MNKRKLFFWPILVLFLSVQFLNAQTDINKNDEKGKKHGLWKGTYPESKRPRYQGTFEHGKETGTFTFYDDTKAGTVIATREFNPTDNSAYTIIYDQSKNKVSEGKEVNKLYEGQWKYYHRAAKEIMTLENYSKGKLEGKRTVYYPNSAIAEETEYKNGKKNGAYRKYSVKGIVLEESIYKNDVYDGPAIYRDPIGNIVAKGNFKAGKKTGIWEFYENGKLVSKDNMNKIKKKKTVRPATNPDEKQ